MNKAIAHILKEQLHGIPIIDKMAGMVQVAEYQDTTYDESGTIPKTITRRIPVSLDAPDDVCGDTSLCPDSSKSGILYFEDRGGSYDGKSGQYNRWKSRLRMVCWFNSRRVLFAGDGEFNEDYSDSYNVDGTEVPALDAAAILINHIVVRLSALNAQNKRQFLRLMIGIEGIPRQNRAIFADYTYDLHNTQYLMHPYEYFAIDLSVDFQMHPACIDQIRLNPEVVC